MERFLMTGLTGVLGSVIGPELEDAFFIVRNGIDNKKVPIGIDPDRIFEGDITLPLCGLSQEDIARLKSLGITKFLHFAANVSFDIYDADGEILKTNFNGTFNALELAKQLNCPNFLHCSTAFSEDKRNPYEKSKFMAERLVEESGLNYSIFRPSAIVGDSITGFTTDFNGYYGICSFLHLLAEKERSRNNNEQFVVNLPIILVISSYSTLNLAPIDWLRDMIVRLINKKPQNEIYYLTHPSPEKMMLIAIESLKILGLSGVIYVESIEERNDIYKNDPPSFLQRQVDKMMDRYIPYTTQERQFPLDSLISRLGCEFQSPPPTDSKFLSIMLGFAVEKNFGRKK